MILAVEMLKLRRQQPSKPSNVCVLLRCNINFKFNFYTYPGMMTLKRKLRRIRENKEIERLAKST